MVRHDKSKQVMPLESVSMRAFSERVREQESVRRALVALVALSALALGALAFCIFEGCVKNNLRMNDRKRTGG